MNRIAKFTAGATAVIAAIMAAPAMASPVTYAFDGTFTDGATASGQISINTYGYLATPTGIDTTAGIFSGFDYLTPGIPTNLLDGDTVLVLSEGAPNWYSRYLYLTFSGPLGLGSDVNNLIANESFECDAYGTVTYGCTGPSDQIRYFTSGVADVPEPIALSIFAAGFAGLFAMRRRKAASIA